MVPHMTSKYSSSARVALLFIIAAFSVACAKTDETAVSDSASASASGEVVTSSGLRITELTPGNDQHPTAKDKVVVHYHGTFDDGTVFDSSVERGKPATFPLNRVIKCWTEGLQLMGVGGKSKLVCPPKIAYGKRGRPPKIPKNARLTFEVELISIE